MAQMKVITAHMSNDEMDVMDMFQGEKRYLRGNPNVRVYTGPNSLEAALENDMMLNHVLNSLRINYAEGGTVGVTPLSDQELEVFRQRGRNGDNGVAILGPRTRALLEICARHSGVNPYDGAPEFFSLSGMFNSFKNGASSLGHSLYNGASAAGHAIGQGAQNVWNNVKQPLTNFAAHAVPAIGTWAGQQLGSKLGSMTDNPALMGLANAGGAWAGNKLGHMGGDYLQGVADNMGGNSNPEHNEQAQIAGQSMGAAMPQLMGAAQHGYNQYQQGASPYQAAKSAYNHIQSQDEGYANGGMVANQNGYAQPMGYGIPQVQTQQGYGMPQGYNQMQQPQQYAHGGAVPHGYYPRYW